MNPLGLEDQKSVISSTGRRIDQVTGSVIVDPELAAEFAKISGSSPRKTTDHGNCTEGTIDDDKVHTARKAQTANSNSFDSLDEGSFIEGQEGHLQSVPLNNDMVSCLLEDNIDSKISQ
jgi:hypothetical protein